MVGLLSFLLGRQIDNLPFPRKVPAVWCQLWGSVSSCSCYECSGEASRPFCSVRVFALEIHCYYENRTFLVIIYFNQVNIRTNQLSFSFLSLDLFSNWMTTPDVTETDGTGLHIAPAIVVVVGMEHRVGRASWLRAPSGAPLPLLILFSLHRVFIFK